MNWTKGWAAPSRSDPVFELLEDGRLFAAQPVVTFDGGDATLIGETARIAVTLSSVSDGPPGSDAGHPPHIDLILLTMGADCSASDVNPAQIKDGAAFQRARLNGQSPQATQHAPSQQAAFVSGSAPRRRQTRIPALRFGGRPLRVDRFHTQAWEQRPLRRPWRHQLQRHAERHGDTDRLPGWRRENVNRCLVQASKRPSVQA